MITQKPSSLSPQHMQAGRKDTQCLLGSRGLLSESENMCACVRALAFLQHQLIFGSRLQKHWEFCSFLFFPHFSFYFDWTSFVCQQKVWSLNALCLFFFPLLYPLSFCLSILFLFLPDLLFPRLFFSLRMSVLSCLSFIVCQTSGLFLSVYAVSG